MNARVSTRFRAAVGSRPDATVHFVRAWNVSTRFRAAVGSRHSAENCLDHIRSVSTRFRAAVGSRPQDLVGELLDLGSQRAFARLSVPDPAATSCRGCRGGRLNALSRGCRFPTTLISCCTRKGRLSLNALSRGCRFPTVCERGDWAYLGSVSQRAFARLSVPDTITLLWSQTATASLNALSRGCRFPTGFAREGTQRYYESQRAFARLSVPDHRELHTPIQGDRSQRAFARLSVPDSCNHLDDSLWRTSQRAFARLSVPDRDGDELVMPLKMVSTRFRAAVGSRL